VKNHPGFERITGFPLKKIEWELEPFRYCPQKARKKGKRK
jgi:hypothetical protein